MGKLFRNGGPSENNHTRSTLLSNETVLRQSPEHYSLPKNLGKRRFLIAQICPPRVIEFYVTPVSRKSKLFVEKCKEVLAVYFILLRCNVIQTRDFEQEGGVKSSGEWKVRVMTVGDRNVFLRFFQSICRGLREGQNKGLRIGNLDICLENERGHDCDYQSASGLAMIGNLKGLLYLHNHRSWWNNPTRPITLCFRTLIRECFKSSGNWGKTFDFSTR